MKWALLALGTVLLVAASLYAFAFLIIFSAKSTIVSYRIETREAHPDYVAVVRTEGRRYDEKGLNEFKETRFAEITPSNPLVLEFDNWPEDEDVVLGFEWWERVWLAIIPRVVAARYKTAAKCDDAGASQEGHYFYYNRPVPPWYHKNGRMTVTYRIQPKQSGDGLELVQTSWSPLWQWAIVPITGAVSFTGIWLVRRTRRSRVTPSAS